MSQQAVYWGLPFLAAALALSFSTALWLRRTESGTRMLFWLTLAVAWWSLCEGIITLEQGLSRKILWTQIQYLGIGFTPPLFTIFILDYCGRVRLMRSKTVLAGLLLPPLAVLALAWTNGDHHLIWARLTLVKVRNMELMDIVHGPLFYVWVGVSYIYLLLGTLMLAWQLVTSQALYRRQAAVMLIGAAAPWLANVIYIAGISPLAHMDLTPLAFTLTAAALFWGLMRYRLADVTPVARTTVFEKIEDAVLVIDGQGRVADLNLAARKLIGRSAKQILGRPAVEIFADWPDLLDRYRDLESGRFEIQTGTEEERSHFEVVVSPLTNRFEHRLGRLYVVRNVTEQRLAQEALRVSEAMFRELVESLPFPVLVVDEDLRTRYVNPTLERVFGFRAATVGGLDRWLEMTVPDSEQRAAMAAADRAWLEGPREAGEMEQLLRDSEGLEHRTLTRRLALGQRIYYIMEDLTQRLEAEQARSDKAKMEGVMEMAGAACHEMNQPLQAVLSQCELTLMRLARGDELHRRMSEIITGLEILSGITSKIQSITRYETMDYNGRHRIIDINKASTRT